jgi:glutamate N-acetyltransferase/amino-acid N-acetyltransferase
MKKKDLYNFVLIENGSVTTPVGFLAAATKCSIKSPNRFDFGIIFSEKPAITTATFTKNKLKAAPVIVCAELLQKNKKFNGILVNSGNANAATGKKGVDDCKHILSQVEKSMNVKTSSLLMASTGVIGQYLPVNKMIKAIKKFQTNLSKEDLSFSKAILTTDKFTKRIALKIYKDKDQSYSIGATSKGAGMICPDMATMLAFITTDAKADHSFLQKTLKKAVSKTFNKITVDGDMSTNDSVFLMANGASNCDIKTEEDMIIFKSALIYICKYLALQIVKDGEGATKVVEIQIKGASSKKDAKKAAFKISNSLLFKTMLFGEDPNWGRIMASIGAANINMDEKLVDIYIDDLLLVQNGFLTSKDNELIAKKIMGEKTFKITVNLNLSRYNFNTYTADIGHKYIDINAGYRS